MNLDSSYDVEFMRNAAQSAAGTTLSNSEYNPPSQRPDHSSRSDGVYIYEALSASNPLHMTGSAGVIDAEQELFVVGNDIQSATRTAFSEYYSPQQDRSTNSSRDEGTSFYRLQMTESIDAEQENDYHPTPSQSSSSSLSRRAESDGMSPSVRRRPPDQDDPSGNGVSQPVMDYGNQMSADAGATGYRNDDNPANMERATTRGEPFDNGDKSNEAPARGRAPQSNPNQTPPTTISIHAAGALARSRNGAKKKNNRPLGASGLTSTSYMRRSAVAPVPPNARMSTNVLTNSHGSYLNFDNDDEVDRVVRRATEKTRAIYPDVSDHADEPNRSSTTSKVHAISGNRRSRPGRGGDGRRDEQDHGNESKAPTSIRQKQQQQQQRRLKNSTDVDDDEGGRNKRKVSKKTRELEYMDKDDKIDEKNAAIDRDEPDEDESEQEEYSDREDERSGDDDGDSDADNVESSDEGSGEEEDDYDEEDSDEESEDEERGGRRKRGKKKKGRAWYDPFWKKSGKILVLLKKVADHGLSGILTVVIFLVSIAMLALSCLSWKDKERRARDSSSPAPYYPVAPPGYAYHGQPAPPPQAPPGYNYGPYHQAQGHYHPPPPTPHHTNVPPPGTYDGGGGGMSYPQPPRVNH